MKYDCGFEKGNKRFVECGAKKVVGVDISEKMLEFQYVSDDEKVLQT